MQDKAQIFNIKIVKCNSMWINFISLVDLRDNGNHLQHVICF